MAEELKAELCVIGAGAAGLAVAGAAVALGPDTATAGEPDPGG